MRRRRRRLDRDTECFLRRLHAGDEAAEEDSHQAWLFALWLSAGDREAAWHLHLDFPGMAELLKRGA